MRERVLDTALALMSEQGAGSTSMRQLAAASGVQVAAIYHYFPSKDALLTAVIDERQYHARLAEQLEVEVSLDLPVEDRLRATFLLFWNGALDESPVLKLLLGEGLRAEPAAQQVGSELLTTFRFGVMDRLRAWVPEVVEAGDAESVVEIIIGQIILGFVQHTFEPQRDPSEIGSAAAAAVVATVSRGLILRDCRHPTLGS